MTYNSAHRNFLAMLLTTVALLIIFQAQAEESFAVQLFDTGTRSATPLPSQAFSQREKWTALAEDVTKHDFKGDVVVFNGKIAVVLRRGSIYGAELYANTEKGFAYQAAVLPVSDGPASGHSEVKIIENSPGGVAIDASYLSFLTRAGTRTTLRYELKPGQSFVQTQARWDASSSDAQGSRVRHLPVKALRLYAPCRFAILPDFFADDLVVDATELPVAQTELPTDNFLMHMMEGGDSIIMAIWNPAREDARVKLEGQDNAKRIEYSEFSYDQDSKIWIALMEGPGIWHRRNIAQAEGGQILPLDWKAPFMAHWRVDWRRDDKLSDSWEMLTQKSDGEYVKHGWYGQQESFGNVDWLKDGRKRWTTVLGSFLYPCWLDKNGQGYLQPLHKVVRFQGPAILYPISRIESTPLQEFTVVDLMRATMGVGPCEYVLDVEGQKKTYEGRPTCASRTILNGIYGNKEQKQKRADVEKTLDEVLAFVRHIRGRIESYVTFGHEMAVYLEEQKKAQPQIASTLTDLQNLTRKMDDYYAQRKSKIKTPQYATDLVQRFRTTLVDNEGPEALAQCKEITAALVDIGGNQDELVGECRVVVKNVRQRAALGMATDPRLATIAKEIRQRTQQMLRNPTSYEAPRH